jgi:hypothetical protein
MKVERASSTGSGTTAKAEDRLRNPAPGSRIEAEQKYGVSLSLVIEQLRLTPTERGCKPKRPTTDNHSP